MAGSSVSSVVTTSTMGSDMGSYDNDDLFGSSDDGEPGASDEIECLATCRHGALSPAELNSCPHSLPFRRRPMELMENILPWWK